MVDCGRVNQTVRDGDVPVNSWYPVIADRYGDAMDRYFLLTHYHKDHISGFLRLLDCREGYFSRVFLPRAPWTAGASPCFWSTPCSPTCSCPLRPRTSG